MGVSKYLPPDRDPRLPALFGKLPRAERDTATAPNSLRRLDRIEARRTSASSQFRGVPQEPDEIPSAPPPCRWRLRLRLKCPPTTQVFSSPGFDLREKTRRDLIHTA